MEIAFPFELFVLGTPVSQQSRLRANRDAWQARIREACTLSLPEAHRASQAVVAVTIYYFPAEPMQGDLDNIIKPILDALSRYVFVDDAQVERLVVQRFLPDGAPELTDPSNVLKQAWQAELRQTLNNRN